MRGRLLNLGAGLALAAAAALGATPEPRVVPREIEVYDPSIAGLSRRARKRKARIDGITEERRRKIGPAGLSRALARQMHSGYRPHGWRS